MKVSRFFNQHSHAHAYHKEPDFYLPLTNMMLTRTSKKELRVLDLGSGDGSFLRRLILSGITGEFMAVDVSSEMIKLAKQNLKEYDQVNLLISDGFYLPFGNGVKFDLIHMDSVLHHLIGKTRGSSTKICNRLLDLLFSMLSSSGIIVIEEMHYESYIIPSLTSWLIFYSLKVLNAFKLDLSRFVKPIIPGLEVNFFSEKELRKMIGRHGKILPIKKTLNRIPVAQKLFLQKEYGHISLMVIPGNATF